MVLRKVSLLAVFQACVVSSFHVVLQFLTKVAFVAGNGSRVKEVRREYCIEGYHFSSEADLFLVEDDVNPAAEALGRHCTVGFRLEIVEMMGVELVRASYDSPRTAGEATTNCVCGLGSEHVAVLVEAAVGAVEEGCANSHLRAALVIFAVVRGRVRSLSHVQLQCSGWTRSLSVARDGLPCYEAEYVVEEAH